MKALIQFWGREDVLFAIAVFPAAYAWIAFESTLIGIATGLISYIIVIATYEYVREKRNWPEAGIVSILREITKFYNPR